MNRDSKGLPVYFTWADGTVHDNPEPTTMRGLLRITMAEWDNLSDLCRYASSLLSDYEVIKLLGYIYVKGAYDSERGQLYDKVDIDHEARCAARWACLQAMNAARAECYRLICYWRAQPLQTEGRAASEYAPDEVNILTKWYRRMVPGGQFMGQEMGVTAGFLHSSSECLSSAGLGVSVLKEPVALGMWAETFRDPNGYRWYW